MKVIRASSLCLCVLSLPGPFQCLGLGRRCAFSPPFPSRPPPPSDAPDAPDRLPELTNDEVARYSRHLVLSTVGVRGQRRLKGSSVLCVGAGGLGSPALLYLAAAGVGTVGIVDADTVDESNLQRQIIHGTGSIGASKCASAAARIGDVNPNVEVLTYEEEFTAETADRILAGPSGGGWDVVLDGSDNFPTKYLLSDACERADVPWVYSAILGFEGQISTFGYRGATGSEVARRRAAGSPLPPAGPTYRDLLPVPPPPGDVPSCAEGGVLGVLPGTFGCMQATEAIKVLLGVGEVLSGRVVLWDALSMRFSEVQLERDPEREPVTELIDYQGFCAGPKVTATPLPPSGRRTMDEAEGEADAPEAAAYRSVRPRECLQRLKTGWAPWVLDVRLETENDIVALPFTDAVVPHRQVSPSDVPTAGDVLVYCKAGVRGKKACAQLVRLGVDPDRLHNLDGGIMGWRAEVDAAMPKY